MYQDNQTRAESEELDHAIALSLAENAIKPAGGFEWLGASIFHQLIITFLLPLGLYACIRIFMEVSNAPFSSKQCVVNLFRVPGLRQRSNNDEEPARTNKDRFNMPSYPPYNTTPFYPSGQRFVPSNPVFWYNFLFCLSY